MDVFFDYLEALNWVAVAVAALSAFIVGSIWYSKPLFGTLWMKGAGIKDKDMTKEVMMKAVVVGVVSVAITATAFGVVFDVFALEGVVDGALLGILIGVGFLGANKIMSHAYEKKDMTYSTVVILGDIVTLITMGVIFGLVN